MNPYNRGFDLNNPYNYIPNPNTPPIRPTPNRPPIPSPCPDYAAFTSFISGQMYPNFPFNNSTFPSQQLTLTPPDSIPETQEENNVGSSSGKKPPAKRTHKKKTAEEKALAAANNQPQKWTTAEEVAITKAWICESKNAIQGNNRHKFDFWDDINNMFHKLMERETYRFNDSLSSKWTEISRAMNAFKGFYYHARNYPRSSETDGDYLANALKAYREDKGWDFKFLHYWEMAKKHSKWADVPSASDSSKRTKTNSSHNRPGEREVEDAVNLDDDDDFEEESRPPDRDKSKNRAHRSSTLGSGSGKGTYGQDLSDIHDTLVQFNTIQLQSRRKKPCAKPLKKVEYERTARKARRYEVSRDEHRSSPRSRVTDNATNEARDHGKI